MEDAFGERILVGDQVGLRVQPRESGHINGAPHERQAWNHAPKPCAVCLDRHVELR